MPAVITWLHTGYNKVGRFSNVWVTLICHCYKQYWGCFPVISSIRQLGGMNVNSLTVHY